MSSQVLRLIWIKASVGSLFYWIKIILRRTKPLLVSFGDPPSKIWLNGRVAHTVTQSVVSEGPTRGECCLAVLYSLVFECVFCKWRPNGEGNKRWGCAASARGEGPQHPLLPLVVHPAQPLPLPHLLCRTAQGSGQVVSVGRGLCSTETICPSWGGPSTSVRRVLIRHALHSLRIRWSLPLLQLGMPQSIRGDQSGALHPP